MKIVARTLIGAILGLTIATGGSASAAPDGLQLTGHKVVKTSTLPSCEYEDGSSGPLPCSWNFGTTDGNGHGLAYYVTGKAGVDDAQRFHYVWASSPLKGHPARDWMSSGQADAFAESDAPRATTRDWERCWINPGKRLTTVSCPDGYKRTS